MLSNTIILARAERALSTWWKPLATGQEKLVSKSKCDVITLGYAAERQVDVLV